MTLPFLEGADSPVGQRKQKENKKQNGNNEHLLCIATHSSQFPLMCPIISCFRAFVHRDPSPMQLPSQLPYILQDTRKSSQPLPSPLSSMPHCTLPSYLIAFITLNSSFFTCLSPHLGITVPRALSGKD